METTALTRHLPSVGNQCEQRYSSDWAAIAAEFFEVLEAKMLDKDKLLVFEITPFSG